MARRNIAPFGDGLSARGTRELRRTGVEIHVQSVVTHVDAGSVEVKGPDEESSIRDAHQIWRRRVGVAAGGDARRRPQARSG